MGERRKKAIGKGGKEDMGEREERGYGERIKADRETG